MTIFELNQDRLQTGILSFFHNHVAFAKLAFQRPGEGEEEKKGMKSPAKSRRGKKAAAKGAVDDAEEEDTKSPPEFYNLYGMYQENGVEPSIRLTRDVLKSLGGREGFGQTFTGGHL